MTWSIASLRGETPGSEKIELLIRHFGQFRVHDIDGLEKEIVVGEVDDEWEELWPVLQRKNVKTF